ncbi:MAG: hypothetical protein CL596_09745 [Alteromonas sp.]|nr:hypothetical protein [Alteromonas sp.]MAY23450.1 hypothetical protein [Flavobacteriaceae bacterium]|tara:strand:+ start:979 stop:1212 length:234 start_codon:yes stop_codon:yes gene_type:complete
MYRKILSEKSFWIKSVWMGFVYAAFIFLVQWTSHNFSTAFLKEIDQPILKLMLFILSGIFIGVLVNFIITWVKLKER